MRLAHFIPYLGRAQGGPVASLAQYAAALADLDCQVTVFSVAAAGDGERMSLDSRVKVVADDAPGWGAFRGSSVLWQKTGQAEFDLVHSHSLWTDVNRLAGALARRRKAPHLLAPCGTLARQALNRSWWKKWPVRIWFQWRALREADCLHAKSEIEFSDIRRLGFANPVAIIANPISYLPSSISQSTSAEDFRRNHDIPRDKRVLLYLGRLHPVKGLPRLIEAWSRLGMLHQAWMLVLAGPDENGFEATLRSQIATAGCGESVRFTGALDDFEKWGALAAAELFVMPSDFENFGSAIVEAMCAGAPVVTTTGTPWKELPAAGAGWWVKPAADELAGALREGMMLPEERRREMGRHAARLASRFSPEQAGRELMGVYRWLLKQGTRPEGVRMFGQG